MEWCTTTRNCDEGYRNKGEKNFWPNKDKKEISYDVTSVLPIQNTQTGKQGIHKSGKNRTSRRTLSDYFLYYRNAALLFLMLRTILSEEMTHKPNNCDNERNRACCPEGWYQAMEPRGRIFLLPPLGRSEKKPWRTQRLKRAFSTEKNKEQGIQAKGETEMKRNRNKSLEVEGHHVWGKMSHSFWQGPKDWARISRKSGHIAEVSNWRPLGHTGLVFYLVDTVITHLWISC